MLPVNVTDCPELPTDESLLLALRRELTPTDRDLMIAAMESKTLYGCICCVAMMSLHGQVIAAQIIDLLEKAG